MFARPESAHHQPDGAASAGTVPASFVPTLPSLTPLPLPSAASAAAPAVGAAGSDLAALAARVAPSVFGAAASAPAALGAAAATLLYPTNTGSDTTDIGEGLRARTRPGQQSVEIERRVDNGLFNTGIGASWERLPVRAWQQVRRDGGVDIVIDHEQLNRVVGQSAPADSRTDGASAMAQSAEDGSPQQQSPLTTTLSEEKSNKPATTASPAAPSLAPSQIDARVLEEARQRDPEEERLLACRAVRAMPGQPAPPGQFDGPGGIGTAVGIRVGPGFPAPKGGYDYSPNNLRHLNGYKGELELKNRIENAIPYEQFVHYGNPAGDKGPDVLTIGPDERLMGWDSKSRMVQRRIGPSSASAAFLDPDVASAYVWNAIRSHAVVPDVGDSAMRELRAGNYNICTVGTGKAVDGYFESVRNNVSTGLRR